MKRNNKINIIVGVILILLLLTLIFNALLTYIVGNGVITIFTLNVSLVNSIFSIIYFTLMFILNNSIYLLLIIFIILNMVIKNDKVMIAIKIITFILMGIFLVFDVVSSFVVLNNIFGLSSFFSGLSIINLLLMISSAMINVVIMFYIINSIPKGRVIYFACSALLIALSIFSVLGSFGLAILTSNFDFYWVIRFINIFVVFITRIVIVIYFYNCN